ncbi:MAG: hypothetical protein ABI807_06965 [Sporichthyaceae bacterium]
MRLTRRGRLAVTALVVVLLLGAGGWLLVTRTPLGPALGLGDGPPCTLDTGSDRLPWTTAEAMTATTVAGVGTRIGATENGVAAAVDRALAAGPETEISPEAARTVYRLLPAVAQSDAASRGVARALLGQRGAALTCVAPLVGPDLAAERTGELGLTPRADAVRLAMRAVFGKQVLGGFEAGGVSNGHVEGSAHYEGRAVDVFYRPITAAATVEGWQTALWLVAHAERLHVATVIFDREIWSTARSLRGWRTYRYPGGSTDNPVLLHEDHVHVDVPRGA